MTDRTAIQLVDQLMLEEQVSLLSGADFWSLPAIERLGIGRLVVTDGPNGARGGGTLDGKVTAAAFPVGIALGATWDVDLLGRVAAALAEEAKDKGAHVLLAPTINLQRGALNGRNFECYSEDPVLTARLATAYIRGLQDNGIAATPKHFAGNESEIQRTSMSSDIDERTLREMYLLPFEAAVKDGGAWAVMSSYNKVNGTFASENPWLLTDVLRGDWGFDGIVMSDWFGSHSTAATVNAGLDLEMPGPTRDRGAKLVAAVQAGEVASETVRGAALNILRLMERTGALDNIAPRVETAVDRPATRALIRQAGAAGIVLLKNAGALPLSGTPRIALIGPNARVARSMGGGSAQLSAHRNVSPWDGLSEAIGADHLTFALGCTNEKFRPLLDGPFTVDWFANPDFSGTPAHTTTMDRASAFLFGELADGHIDATQPYSLRLTGSFTPPATGRYEAGLFAAGRARMKIAGTQIVEAWDSWTQGHTFFEQGCDERIGHIDLTLGVPVDVVIEFRSSPSLTLGLQAFRAGLGLPTGQAEMDAAVQAAATADVAVLCVGRSAEWDSEGEDLPDMTLPGQQDALIAAVAAVAKRTIVVLQTGGPVEMPWLDQVDAVLQAWYPGQEAGHAIADVLLGHAEPGGRLPQSFPFALTDTPTQGLGDEVYPGHNGHVRYDEGLYIGYRHHNRSNTPAMFAFGHGLGYADVSLNKLTVDSDDLADGGKLTLRVNLTNHSDRAGSQVVQLYVCPHNPPVDRPAAELKAFAKRHLAPRGQDQALLTLTLRDFAWFDVTRGAWVASAGRYTLRAALNATDPGFTAEVVLHRETLLPR